ncbi:MAG: HAD family phosphatase [Clostridia bacterium]|nr:HAD family phosphatase [Clostridia bacterium]
MTQYKLIASDLDGTFLNGEMKITPENRRAIAALQERGVLFVPASGRAFGEMDEELREDPLLRYYITSDGAMILDKVTGERDTACMDRALTQKIFDILEQYQVFFVVHCDGASYMDADRLDAATYAHHRITIYYAEILSKGNLAVSDFRSFYRSREEVEQIFVYFHSDEEMAECRTRLEQLEALRVVSSERGTFEIISAAAGKGNGLKRLAKRLGLELSQTIAVGDSANDLTMLRIAGLSLAVSNAWDEVKKESDQVICSCDGHICQYILEHILKEERS